MAATQVGISPALDSLTPAMRQFVEQKKRVGDAVLLFRMGDFYETFYDDAILCSRVLGIALTTRDKNSPSPVPLAGIPYHALDGYLSKLVAAGYKVAISEQLEDPKQAKGVVRRDVVRIVTPGTLTEETLLADRDDNVLAALCLRGEEVGLAIVELACGRFETIESAAASLLDTLVRLRPAELLLAEESGPEAERIGQELRSLCGTAISRRPVHEFSAYQAQRSMQEHFGVATLAGFGFDAMTNSLVAAGGIIQYLQETQKTALAHVSAIRRRAAADSVQIDHSSWRSLEIDRTLRGGQREGSLLHAIDRTVHAAGGRMLRHWLAAPLTSADAIRERQQAVGLLLEEPTLRDRIRQKLKGLADVERIAGRAALGRASPRDLESLSRTLGALPNLLDDTRLGEIAYLHEIIVNLDGVKVSEGGRPLAGARGSDSARREPRPPIAESNEQNPIQPIAELASLLQRAIRENPSNNMREGGFIADGYHAELDRLRAVSHDGQNWLADYQRREIERTGITHLKAGYNRVFGYYLEVPHSGTAKVPADFIRKQTVKNAERYITETLKNHEHEVLTAQDRANQLESELFEELRKQVAQWLVPLGLVAGAIARLDCVTALAELAEERRCVRPEIIDSGELEIIDGRHPVLDQAIGDDFVPNDACMIGDARVFVITGPNMAGKSTYIRQVALLTIMAQIGAFVPARRMALSLVDRIFARVGSSDEIMRGQSTFMVEMIEAANILHNATRDSLVILDELGRGTSTFDGLSLAWAVTEHLANSVGCRTLVATHYHELIELASLLKNVRNFNVAVREIGNRQPAIGNQSTIDNRQSTIQESSIVFLHKIVEGGANQSFGIHVARLAGVPRSVIDRSREVLDQLQRRLAGASTSPALAAVKSRDVSQLALFREPGDEILDALRAMDPDRLTPLEALTRLKEWKDRYL
jgi:DNA mismatch repair protein MutS